LKKLKPLVELEEIAAFETQWWIAAAKFFNRNSCTSTTLTLTGQRRV